MESEEVKVCTGRLSLSTSLGLDGATDLSPLTCLAGQPSGLLALLICVYVSELLAAVCDSHLTSRPGSIHSQDFGPNRLELSIVTTSVVAIT